MDYESILKKYWGYDSFRGIQREIIDSVCSGHDTLGLMPTGGGKSITFQVPAMAMEGLCLVITPLLALMRDQVEHLRHIGIKAAAVSSEMSHQDVLATLENAVFGGIKLLYVSPERLSSDLFRAKFRHMAVSFICVDEAHCISEWGYDFRPSYLTISELRKDFPHVPVLALTATATLPVVDDIQEKLLFREKRVFRMSFERKNLSYQVHYAPDKLPQLIHALNCSEGSAIVYCRSRQHTQDYAEGLCHAGINATFFHAGLDNVEKSHRQTAWQEGKVRVIVATNAFGMGIDKPDVRLVIHVDCPSSMEAYFQEAGRAGRDGKPAEAILLYSDADRVKLKRRISETFPDKDYIRKVYEHLAYFFQVGVGSGYDAVFEFPIDKFCYTYHFFAVPVRAALYILDRSGYIEYIEEKDMQARVRFILERDELYRARQVSPDEDKVIVALLRHYSGLFVNYRYIDEALLAEVTGLHRTEVYMALKSLSMKKIISFIPQRRTPYIRYRQRREESRHIMIPASAYDNLKDRLTERIHDIIYYAQNDQVCRNRQLLRYFGEKKSHDCGICDVCRHHYNNKELEEQEVAARAQILDLLSDGRQHDIHELHGILLPYEAIESALMALITDEEVKQDESLVSLG